MAGARGRRGGSVDLCVCVCVLAPDADAHRLLLRRNKPDGSRSLIAAFIPLASEGRCRGTEHLDEPLRGDAASVGSPFKAVRWNFFKYLMAFLTGWQLLFQTNPSIFFF